MGGGVTEITFVGVSRLVFLYTTTQYYTTYNVACRHNFKLLKVEGGGFTEITFCRVSRLVFLYNTTQYYTTYKLASTRNFKLLKVEGEGGLLN